MSIRGILLEGLKEIQEVFQMAVNTGAIEIPRRKGRGSLKATFENGIFEGQCVLDDAKERSNREFNEWYMNRKKGKQYEQFTGIQL